MLPKDFAERLKASHIFCLNYWAPEAAVSTTTDCNTLNLFLKLGSRTFVSRDTRRLHHCALVLEVHTTSIAVSLAIRIRGKRTLLVTDPAGSIIHGSKLLIFNN